MMKNVYDDDGRKVITLSHIIPGIKDNLKEEHLLTSHPHLFACNVLLPLNNQCLVWGTLFPYYDHVTMYSSIDSSIDDINDERDILETRSGVTLNIRRY